MERHTSGWYSGCTFAAGLCAALLIASAGCDNSGNAAAGGAGGSGGSGGATGASGTARLASQADRASMAPLKVDPIKVDLGTHSPCEPDLKFTAKVTNTTNSKVEIRRLISSCACTTATIRGNRTLAPGEEAFLDATIKLSGIGGKSQRVDLVGEMGPIGSLRLDYVIQPPVRIQAEAVAVGTADKSGWHQVTRVDGKPVKVLKFIPDIGEAETREGGAQFIRFDGAKAAAFAASSEGQMDGSWSRDADGTWNTAFVIVVSDHPDCPNFNVFLQHQR